MKESLFNQFQKFFPCKTWLSSEKALPKSIHGFQKIREQQIIEENEGILEQESLEGHGHVHRTKSYRVAQYLKYIWNIGLITYGGPISNIVFFKKKFIHEMDCITEEHFLELMSICQALPGLTSTQLVISISMYATGDLLAGILAFCLFSGPTFFVMYILAILSDLVAEESVNFVLPGFRIVTIAVIFQAFEGLFRKIIGQKLKVFICFVAAIAYGIVPKIQTVFLTFFLAGCIGCLSHRLYPPKKQESSSKIISLQNSQKFKGIFFGQKNAIIFLCILAFVFLMKPLEKEYLNLMIFNSFYKIGSLVIGGGHVIIPLMLSEFSETELLMEEDYFNGVSLISIMPGPLFNLSVYIGALFKPGLIGPLLGSLSAFLGLYIPCFLFLLFTLPFWERFHSNEKLQRVIGSMCAASTGFILASVFILFVQCLSMKEQPIWEVLVCFLVIFSYILLKLELPLIVTFLVGNFLYVLINQILTIDKFSPWQ